MAINFRFIFLCAALGLGSLISSIAPSQAQGARISPSTFRDLPGTYQLESMISGRIAEFDFGDRPIGLATFTKDRVYIVVTRRDLTRFSRSNLFSSTWSLAGKYKLVPKTYRGGWHETISITVDASLDQRLLDKVIEFDTKTVVDQVAMTSPPWVREGDRLFDNLFWKKVR